MAGLLVSDTSILIDLERGEILPALFLTSYEIAVPDMLYSRELEAHDGSALKNLGLKVLAVDEAGVRVAQTYRMRERRISLVDGLALVLAKDAGLAVIPVVERILDVRGEKVILDADLAAITNCDLEAWTERQVPTMGFH